jgi:DNA-binding transcriptional ArsR family regulator
MPPPTTKKKKAFEEPGVLSDVVTLKAVADPLRIQILMELSPGPKTVKEIAADMDVPPTRLYYHFKILERAGLIRVAGRRMVSGIEERSYEATASSWTTAPEATATIVASGIIEGLLGVVRAELELALRSKPGVPVGEPSSPVSTLVLTRLALSEPEVREVQERINAVMEDFGEDGAPPVGKRIYHMLFAGYRAPAELKKPNDELEARAPKKRGR